MSHDNFINLSKMRAKCRRLLRSKKLEGWRGFFPGTSWKDGAASVLFLSLGHKTQIIILIFKYEGNPDDLAAYHSIALSSVLGKIAEYLVKNILYGLINHQNDEELGNGRYIIEGRVFPPEPLELTNWQVDTRVHVNGGEYIGFIREDGNFLIHNVPSGSYVVEIIHPDYMYEPVRVEINSKGKYRARKVNYVQTSQVIQVPYPLRMKALSKYRYFQVREQWRLTDFLFNPMVIMMVLPLLLIMILPKMMNDPETKEDLKQISNFAKMSDMPEMSEMITSLFSGAPTAKASSSKTPKQAKKRQ
ncbi:ER membrane protein complex subunit 7 [Eumeta japonica]|uniref:ER membrane protein complex subunit 7 n=1 Tax=Eumeta variegata TaxID=151549 RepID=A0A4C1WH71_EUMVA|nr:ER membrane protein complex subunit 7 [Eumeta japonica]